MKRPFYNAIHSLFLNPRHFVAALLYRFGRWIPDRIYLRIIFWLETKETLDLTNPKTFNEKLQWLKLYNQKPEYTAMADKLAAKEIVKKRIGQKYIVPTLYVYDNVDEINWDILPNQFVIKTNHDSGGNGVVVCYDKTKFSIKNAMHKIKKSLRTNSFIVGREWPYKNIEKKVFVETYLTDDNNGGIKDYKFYCFDGKVKAMFICSDRATGHVKMDYFDENFKPLNITQGHQQNIIGDLQRPDKFYEMKMLAEALSIGIPHVRIDFYAVNGNVYFSEYTFFDSGGLAPFEPKEWNNILGEYIVLPEKYIEE